MQRRQKRTPATHFNHELQQQQKHQLQHRPSPRSQRPHSHPDPHRPIHLRARRRSPRRPPRVTIVPVRRLLHQVLIQLKAQRLQQQAHHQPRPQQRHLSQRSHRKRTIHPMPRRPTHLFRKGRW